MHRVDVVERAWTEDEAHAVYDILVEECHARECWRDNFVYSQMRSDFPREYRFQGAMGFGGKLWRNDDRIYVSYYSEDRDSEKEQAKKAADERLANFVADAEAGTL
jgi:hypothetical protein